MLRIVIAEDNIISSMDLGELLSARGHQVVGVAASGMEAIHMGETLSPDLILMEINMPGPMDGVPPPRPSDRPGIFPSFSSWAMPGKSW